MYLVIGLGNPGIEYEETRHNAGFMAVDHLASVYGISIKKSGFTAVLGRGEIEGVDVMLMKPQTFMNRSGEPAKEVVDYFKVPIGNILVLYDDIDLPYGQIRIKRAGGSGGHRGVQSVISSLGTADLARVRIGIGRPASGDVSMYVLSPFDGEEAEGLGAVLETVKGAVEMVMVEGIEKAMNSFN